MKHSPSKRHASAPPQPPLVVSLAQALQKLNIDLPILAVRLEAGQLLIIFAGGRQERFPLHAVQPASDPPASPPPIADRFVRLAMAALGHDRHSPPDWSPSLKRQPDQSFPAPPQRRNRS